MATMIKIGRLMVALVVLGLPTLVSAEFYKYVDKDGKVQFTDNIANIPADQRSQVQEYEDAPEKPRAGVSGDSETTKAAAEKEPLSDEDNGSAAAEQLRETGRQLGEEYEALMKEKEELEKQEFKRLTSRAGRNLVERINDLNARIADYDQRLEAHNKAVEAHNARIENKARAGSAQAEPPSK